MNAARYIEEVPPEIKDGSCEAPLFGVDSLFGLITGARAHKVYDGDTMRVTFTYRKQPTTFKLRVMHVDTPEMHPRDKDGRTEKDIESEKALAREAKARVKELCDGRLVVLSVEGKGDPYGRLLARVYLESGEPLDEVLLRERLAYPYEGGTKRKDWLGLKALREEFVNV